METSNSSSTVGLSGEGEKHHTIIRLVKRIALAVIIFILCRGMVYAQQGIKDKNQRAYHYDKQSGKFQAVPQTRKGVDSLLTISWASRNKDLSKTLAAAQNGLQLADWLHDKKGIARAQYLMGVSYQRLGSSDQGLKHFLTALDLSIAGNYIKLHSRILVGMANLYVMQKNYKLAAEYYKKAIKEMKQTGNDERRAVATMNLGALHYYKKEYKESLYYYYQTLKILDGPAHNTLLRMVATTNIGLSNLNLGRYPKAEGYLLKATRYFDEQHLGRNQSGAYIYLAKLYRRWGNRDQKALKYARKGLKKAQNIGYQQYIIEGYSELAKIYEAQKDYTKALSTYKHFKAASDTLLNSKRTAQINKLQTSFDLKQKNKKIKLLHKKAALRQAQLDTQKLWRKFLLTALLLFVAILVLLYWYYHQKKKANLLLEKKNGEIEEKNRLLVRLDGEKDQFLGMAAHDLRNPLSGIRGVIRLIDDAEKVTEEQLQEYIEIIGISAERMLNLINNLLNVNAIDNGTNHLRIKQLEVNKVIKDEVKNFEKMAAEKGVQLATKVETYSNLVLADEGALQRILANLISNAVKYSQVGSSVTIGTQVREKDIAIFVNDTGEGIPIEEQGLLFKRFSNISTNPTGDEGSTGLGLFIVKNLVESMNGRVWCESSRGEGSTFFISIPIAVREKMPAL